MSHGGGARVGPSNHVLLEVEIPHGKGQFWGLYDPMNIIGSLCCGVRSKRNNSVLNNGITPDYNAFNSSVPHCIVPREKKSAPHPCDAVFRRINWPLVVIAHYACIHVGCVTLINKLTQWYPSLSAVISVCPSVRSSASLPMYLRLCLCLFVGRWLMCLYSPWLTRQTVYQSWRYSGWTPTIIRS